MELRHLRYFLVLAEQLHFGRAAAKLNMAQPPLSQQIRQLEDEIGVKLFDRTSRQVRLTEAGRVLRDQVDRLLNQLDEAVLTAQRAERGEIGRLRIGFVGSASSAFLPPVIRAFRRTLPDVELHFRELTTAQQLTALADDEIDVGIVRPPVSGRGLIVETVLREPLLVALPAPHPLASHSVVPLHTLADDPFVISPRHQGSGLHDTILDACMSAGFAPRIVQEATQMQTIIALVAAEIGVALVPASVSQNAISGVTYRPLLDAPDVEIAVVWKVDHANPALARFLELVRGGPPA